MHTTRVTRVYDLAREAGVQSRHARQALDAIGHPTKSASTKVDLLPAERDAFVGMLTGTQLTDHDPLGLGFEVGKCYRSWNREIDLILGYDVHGYVHVKAMTGDRAGQTRRHLTDCGDRKPVPGPNPF